jgi:ribosomal protein L21E
MGSKIIQDTKDKVALIRKRMLTAQSRQKRYVDKGRLLVNFEVGDQVFLKVSPMKGVMRFGKKGKIKSKVCWPFHNN